MTRWLREPTVRFFILGALLFLAHHLLVGDPRTIGVTPGVRAEVARRFRDHAHRAPSPAELETALGDWKRDEALYREALRERLDRDDATIRTVLADKIRARAALEVAKTSPSDAELERWLAAHREVYDRPVRYAFEWVPFAKAQASAQAQRDRFERAANNDGADPTTLGRPIFAATLTAAELREKFGPGVSEDVARFRPGQWQRRDHGEELLLVRVTRTEGGPPRVDEVRPRLIADYSLAERERQVQQAVQVIVDRYRFEDRP